MAAFTVLRQIRTRLHLSQAECAAALGLAVETFRTCDAGRRPAPLAIVRRAQRLQAKRSAHERVPLQVLAHELHVHVRTLRAAARDGTARCHLQPTAVFRDAHRDSDATLVGLRHRLALSQQQLATRVGAAGKAVVYQWESGKRKPSPVFWMRITRLQRQHARSKMLSGI